MKRPKSAPVPRPAPPIVAKVDYKKSHPELYRAGRKVSELRPPAGTFLAVDGVGEPGGAAFRDAIRQLFSLAYTLKFAMKKAGASDFSVPSLECVWPDNVCGKPKAEWKWRLMLRVPPCVKARPLQQAPVLRSWQRVPLVHRCRPPAAASLSTPCPPASPSAV